MGNVIGKLKTSEPLRIPFGEATCQVLDWNRVKCSLQLKCSQKEMAIVWRSSRNNVQMDDFLHRHQPQHISLSQANSRNMESCSVGFVCADVPFGHRRFKRWINESRSAQQTGVVPGLNRSPCFRLIHILDGQCKWNWPFTRGGQLLTLRERGSSPLAWLDEYKLTYSPSPPSSFALSLYGKRGGTQTWAWGSGEGAHSVLPTDVRYAHVTREER